MTWKTKREAKKWRRITEKNGIYEIIKPVEELNHPSTDERLTHEAKEKITGERLTGPEKMESHGPRVIGFGALEDKVSSSYWSGF